MRNRVWLILIGAMLVSVVAASGCSSSGTSSPTTEKSTPSTSTTISRPVDPVPADTPATTASTTSTLPKRGPLGSGEAVTIAFGGDASFQGLGARATADPTGLLVAIAPLLSGADLAMVNLETAVGNGGTPEPKAFTFQAPATVLDALAASGVDVVSMANNHGMDYGPAGLESTLAVKKDSPIPIIGIGEDDTAAYAPFIAEVNGQRIGFIAASDVFDSNLVQSWTAGPGKPGIASANKSHEDRLVRAVTETRTKVDTLVVYLHYGTETQTCPNARQKELVDLLGAAGGDIIVGSHAHRLQGVGYHGDKLVAYGLGNFIFAAPSAAGRRSGVLVATATGNRIDSFEWKPATIRGSVPVPLEGPDAQAELDQMADLRRCASLSDSSLVSQSGPTTVPAE